MSVSISSSDTLFDDVKETIRSLSSSPPIPVFQHNDELDNNMSPNSTTDPSLNNNKSDCYIFPNGDMNYTARRFPSPPPHSPIILCDENLLQQRLHGHHPLLI